MNVIIVMNVIFVINVINVTKLFKRRFSPYSPGYPLLASW